MCYTYVQFSILSFAVLQSLVLLCLIRFPFLMPTSYYRMALRWTGYYTEHSHQVSTAWGGVTLGGGVTQGGGCHKLHPVALSCPSLTGCLPLAE